jgi:hypothetical protein
MRDINRIDIFTKEFARLWKENFPDWRFGQMCSNFFGWLASEKKIDLFFPEEVQMLEYFYEYIQSLKHAD